MIKTSFTFQLGTSDTKEQSVSAEIDTRPVEEGGDNATRLGKTSDFKSGEKIAFLIFLPTNLEIDYVKSTLDGIGGSISKGNKISIPIKDEVTFESLTSTATLGKYPIGKYTTQWIGNNLGAIALDKESTTIKLPEPSIKINPKDSEVVKKRKQQQLNQPGVCIINYTTEAYLYHLNTPTQARMKAYGKPPYPVSVVIYCKEKE